MKTKDITLTAVLLAFLTVCSQIAVPLGPVPVTLQTFAVVLIGMLVKPKHALLTTSLFMVAGLIGFPVFAGGMGSFHSILSPSFGFVLGFIPAAALQAVYLNKQKQIKTRNLFCATLINFMCTYTIGLSYMALILNGYLGNALSVPQILMTGLIPFVPGDILKNVTTVVIAKRLRPRLKFAFH